MLRYFIRGKEYSFRQIWQLAVDSGYRIESIRGIMDQQTVAESVSEHLSLSGMVLRITGKEERKKAEDKKLIPLVKQENNKKNMGDQFKCGQSEMLAYYGDSLYKFDTTMLDNSCWTVQIFGYMGCFNCKCKHSSSCDGAKYADVLKDDKPGSVTNELGHEIPIAKIVGKRDKREWGKKCMAD